MGRRTAAAGDSAPAGDAPPIFFLRHQKENAPRPVEKKTCSAGRPAQAQPSCRRRGKVGSPLRQSETETRRPWGNLQPGEVQGYPPAPLPAAAHAPAKNQAAPSEAEGAEREAGQMRSCTPTTSAPSATGRQSGKSQKSIACPKARPNRSRHWYADPRTRGGPLHRSAPGAFFSYTGRGAFSFWRNQKENGGRIAQLAPQLNPPGG